MGRGGSHRHVLHPSIRQSAWCGPRGSAHQESVRHALEPFVSSDLNLFEKPQDSLYRITQADIKESFADLREDLPLMTGGARLVNLVAAVTGEGDPCPPIFDTLLEGLRALQQGGDVVLITMLFQIRLLGQTGFVRKPITVRDAATFFKRRVATRPSYFHLSPVDLSAMRADIATPVDVRRCLQTLGRCFNMPCNGRHPP